MLTACSVATGKAGWKVKLKLRPREEFSDGHVSDFLVPAGF
jgi:hypothetical protein